MINLADGQKVGSLHSIDQSTELGELSLPDITGRRRLRGPKTLRNVHGKQAVAVVLADSGCQSA